MAAQSFLCAAFRRRKPLLPYFRRRIFFCFFPATSFDFAGTLLPADAVQTPPAARTETEISMNILCCFKISPDYDKVVEKDWAAVGSNGPDTSYVPRSPGCYDEAALELALRLRDEATARGDTVRVTAATVSNTAPAAFVRQLYALGVDRVVRINAQGAADFRPGAVSAVLCSAFSGESFDLILCGAQSAEGGGLTPYRLAQRFGFPCFADVTDLHLTTSGGVRATREVPGGERSATVTIPAVYAVGNAKHPYLRLATVRQRMAVSNRVPDELEAPTAETTEPLRLLRFSRPAGGRSCVFVEGESCAEKAAALLALCPEVRA